MLWGHLKTIMLNYNIQLSPIELKEWKCNIISMIQLCNVELLVVIQYFVSHLQTPPNSLIYVKTNVTVRRILLPTNGKIILKPSVTIRFSEQSSCAGMPSCACVILFISSPYFWVLVYHCTASWRVRLFTHCSGRLPTYGCGCSGTSMLQGAFTAWNNVLYLTMCSNHLYYHYVNSRCWYMVSNKEPSVWLWYMVHLSGCYMHFRLHAHACKHRTDIFVYYKQSKGCIFCLL